jgi:nucleoside-diphosphate-sugar epimerase
LSTVDENTSSAGHPVEVLAETFGSPLFARTREAFAWWFRAEQATCGSYVCLRDELLAMISPAAAIDQLCNVASMRSSLMRTLLLGATGQIGHALAQALADTGEHEVSVMVRNAHDLRLPDNVRVLLRPEFSPGAFQAALRGIDQVIYGIGLPEQFTFDPGIFETVNCRLLGTFLEELRKSNIRNLTYISTYEVFENSNNWIDETHPIADESHMTPYFQSMVRAYRLVIEYAEKNGIKLTTIHPAAVFGGLNTGGGITNFMENLASGNWHKVPFITRTRFPAVHVDSLTGAIIKSIGNPGAYIVSDQMTSLEEIAWTMRGRIASYVPITMPVSITKLGVTIVEWVATRIGVKPFASTTQLDYLTKGWEPSPDKTIRELSWKPMTLAEGIDRYLLTRHGFGGQVGATHESVLGDCEAAGSINQQRRVSPKTIAHLQLVTAAGLLAYWLLFFTVGLAPVDPPFGYFVFQHTFTVPDIILALGLIRAATWLLSEDGVQRSRGRALSLVCSGGLLLLGKLDISFNVLNSFYSWLPVDTLVELVVNAWCIGFGVLSALACAAPSSHEKPTTQLPRSQARTTSQSAVTAPPSSPLRWRLSTQQKVRFWPVAR